MKNGSNYQDRYHEIRCFVESPLFGKGKLLVERELLNRLTIMDGERKQACIGKLEASNNKGFIA